VVVAGKLIYGPKRETVKARVTFRDPYIELEAPVGATLLEAAAMSGAPVGTHCGGVGACASCHVRIEHGAEHLSKANDIEEDALDRVFDVRPSSRLGCQARIETEGDIVVRITEESIDAWLREHPRKKAP
jgi:2Fe-2S ferredoxin